MARAGATAAVLLVLAALAGCAKDLRQENSRLRTQLLDTTARGDQLERQNQELTQQLQQSTQRVEALQQLGPARTDLLPQAAAIRIGRHSSPVDTDGTGGEDAVRVLVQPLDAQGHTIKAAGSLLVELYDLAAPPEQNLLGRCEVSPQDLTQHWYSTFGSDHYSVECPLDRPPQHPELTVRVQFTDLVNGNAFAQQKVIAVATQTQPAAEAVPAQTMPAQPAPTGQ